VEETTVVGSDIPDAAVGIDVASAVAAANPAVGTAANAGAVGIDFTVGASVAGDNGDFPVDDTNVMTDAIVVAAVADDSLFNAEVAVADGGPTVVDVNVGASVADPDECVAVLDVVGDAVNNEDSGSGDADKAPVPAAVAAGEVVAVAVAEVDVRRKGVLHRSRLLAIMASSSVGSLLQFPGRIHY
jgi:hypothetical protein